MDQDSKYNRELRVTKPFHSLVYIENLNLTVTMKKTPTLKNILHFQNGSTALPEHYCSLSGSHYLLTSQNKILVKVFLTEVLKDFPKYNPKNYN